MSLTSGYDSPRRLQEEDDLGRWRLAAELVQIISSTPPGWSARIGLFGKWGEGKTTVLNFVHRMLSDRGDLVFWFNPWGAKDWNDVWNEFGNALLTALDEADIDVPGITKLQAKKWGRKIQDYAEPIQRLAEAEKHAKIGVPVAFSIVKKLLSVEGRQLSEIRKALGSRRVVVLVDDLDRTDPRLVPQILLAMREVLDLPDFAFILAFDENIVGQSLAQYHPAWTNRKEFFEKIFDFQIRLPHVTPIQIHALLRKALKRYCPFVDCAAFDPVGDLLPLNPRKAGALVRNLSVLGAEAARHDSDELNWTDILLAQLVRLESEDFLEHFLASIIDYVGMTYQVTRYMEEKKGLDPDAIIQKKLDALLEKAGVEDEPTKDRLRNLATAVRTHGSFLFNHNAEFAIRPHLVTWREFRAVLKAWVNGGGKDQLLRWLRDQAQSRSAQIEDVTNELFNACLERRGQLLNTAADSDSEEDLNNSLQEAHEILSIANVLVFESSSQIEGILRTPEIFQRFYTQHVKWIHFRKNTSDVEARTEERNTLIRFLSGIVTGPEKYCSYLTPWDSARPYPSVSVGAAQLQETLNEDLFNLLAPSVRAKSFDLFFVANGISRLLRNDNTVTTFRYFLLNRQTSEWTVGTRAASLIEIFNQAPSNAVVQGNCF